MRKSTVMAMLLLSVSLIACDNQEAVEVAENTEITENIDSNETEVDPVLETEEAVSEDVVSEETKTEEAVSEDVVSEETETDETTSEDVVSEETATDETASENVETKTKDVPTEASEKADETIVENSKPTAPVPGKETGNGEYVDADGNEWTQKRTWTASNGVVLKIKDEYAHWDFNIATNRMAFDSSEILIIDDLDLRPGTPDFDAIVEFEYGTGAYQGGTEKMKISAADLPLVATPATKQTSAPKTDSWNAYVAQFNPLWKYQATGSYESDLPQLQNYGTGIGLISGIGDGYIFNLDWIGDCWKLTITGALTELQWNSVRNSIRLVSPDGQQLYEEIYRQFYEDNPTFPEYDMWVNIGGSQAMAADATVSDYIYFYFK